MALDPKFESLVHRYVALLMTDGSARDELSRFPAHDAQSADYHAKLVDFVNKKLPSDTPLPVSMGADFHKRVSDLMEPFRSHVQKHAAERSVMAIDGFDGNRC